MLGVQKAGDRVQNGRLTRAVRTDQREEGKPMVAVATNEAARKQGIKAGDLVRGASKILGGGGGGKPDFAQGGGADATKINEALEALANQAMKG